MKKTHDEALERQPLAVGAKMLEMKNVGEQASRAVRQSRIREELAGGKSGKKAAREFIRTENEPMQLKIKKTHSLGDFYGKFHPSKSTKGIKRSE